MPNDEYYQGAYTGPQIDDAIGRVLRGEVGGPPGVQGPQGETGPQGPTGPKGPPGPIGVGALICSITGAVSPPSVGEVLVTDEFNREPKPGEKGQGTVTGEGISYWITYSVAETSSNTISIESVTDIRGQDGTVSFNDLTEEQKEGLKGETGPAGPPGPIGPQGPQGPAGGVGQDVSGKSFPITDGTSIEAEANSEIFNDYAERTYETVANDGAETSVAATGNIATKAYSHAEGERTSALGEASHAEGFRSVASGAASHAEGGAFTDKPGPQATGYAAHAEGVSTIASGAYSHAEGCETLASGYAAHAEGYRITGGAKVTASGEGSHAEGLSTLASGVYSHAEGEKTVALGYASHVEGYKCYSEESTKVAVFLYCEALSDRKLDCTFNQSPAYGNYDFIKSNAQIGQGVLVYCPQLGGLWEFKIIEISETNVVLEADAAVPGLESIMNYGTPIGLFKLTDGNPLIEPSHAEGDGCGAIGAGHAEGDKNLTLSGHSEGMATYSFKGHAEGVYSKAIEEGSHAEGVASIALGLGGHAEGIHCVTSTAERTIILDLPTKNEEEKTMDFPITATFCGLEMSHKVDEFLNNIEIGKTTIYFPVYGLTGAQFKLPYGTIMQADSNRLVVKYYDDIDISYLTRFNGSVVGITESEPYTDYDYAGHAEGYGTISASSDTQGKGTHTQGELTVALGGASHAGGYNSIALSFCSTAQGDRSIAVGAYETAIGRCNVIGPIDQAQGPTNLFTVGNGVNENNRSNAFRVDTWGDVYAKRNYNSSGADYAELFEWSDGNPEGEQRIGRFVTLRGDKIQLAGPGCDYILGIVSGSPSVVGDVFDDQWQGMYLTDVYGRPIMEEVEVPQEAIEVPDPKDPEKTIRRTIRQAHKETRQKLNPDYDPTVKYIPRTKRPEWDAVGMLGKLVLIDDGSCQVDGYCAPGEDGVATNSAQRTAFRVIERLDDSHVRVLIK